MHAPSKLTSRKVKNKFFAKERRKMAGLLFELFYYGVPIEHALL